MKRNDDADASHAEFAFGARTHRERGGDLSHDDDVQYRTAYEASPHRLADRSYEDVRPAYRLGHLAAETPDRMGRTFEGVENDIQRGWGSDLIERYGAWESVRPFARDAYERRLASVSERENANRVINSPDNLSDSVEPNENQ